MATQVRRTCSHRPDWVCARAASCFVLHYGAGRRRRLAYLVQPPPTPLARLTASLRFWPLVSIKCLAASFLEPWVWLLQVVNWIRSCWHLAFIWGELYREGRRRHWVRPCRLQAPQYFAWLVLPPKQSDSLGASTHCLASCDFKSRTLSQSDELAVSPLPLSHCSLGSAWVVFECGRRRFAATLLAWEWRDCLDPGSNAKRKRHHHLFIIS